MQDPRAAVTGRSALTAVYRSLHYALTITHLYMYIGFSRLSITPSSITSASSTQYVHIHNHPLMRNTIRDTFPIYIKYCDTIRVRALRTTGEAPRDGGVLGAGGWLLNYLQIIDIADTSPIGFTCVLLAGGWLHGSRAGPPAYTNYHCTHLPFDSPLRFSV